MWVHTLMTAQHEQEREPWVGKGYGRPQNFTPLDGRIWVLAPPRGLSLVFLSLVLALMMGSKSISGGPIYGLANVGGLELALMMGHAAVGQGGA